jgi:hypothetical protein
MAPPPPPANAGRVNEYFVPRDGIDREVITADICRYLGNDALVRPGTYEVHLHSIFRLPVSLEAKLIALILFYTANRRPHNPRLLYQCLPQSDLCESSATIIFTISNAETADLVFHRR